MAFDRFGAAPDAPVMTRPARLAVLATPLLALVLGACGGQAALPELTDPTEILQAAAENAASATAVHLDATADGGLRMVSGPATTTIQLDGTTANADIDLAGGNARVTFAAPALLGIRGELLLVDGTAYAKTSMSGTDYRKLPLESLPSFGRGPTSSAAPGASPSGASGSVVAGLAQFLATPELQPVKGEDTACGNSTCYQVTIDLTADELASLGLGGDGQGVGLPIPSDLPIPMPDLSNLAGVTFTALVEKDTRQLSEVTATVQAAEAATATLDLRFSKWGDAVTVEAPPADQVSGG